MKFLLDNCISKHCLAHFPQNAAQHCIDLGWDQLDNGELLRTANGEFNVLVTIDKNMQYQSSLKGLQICVAILNVHGNFPNQLLGAILGMLENQALLITGEFVIIEP